MQETPSINSPSPKLRDEARFLQTLKDLGGRANSSEIRHLGLDYMKSNEFSKVGDRLRGKKLVTKKVVAAPFGSRGETIIAIWELVQ